MEITYHIEEFSIVFLVSELIKHIMERATLAKTSFKSVDDQTRRPGPKDTCEILRRSQRVLLRSRGNGLTTTRIPSGCMVTFRSSQNSTVKIC